ncbi:hypothetical protein GCK32_021001 [Trichostrongylus colubriformis]|uniref:Uncharacterized protein n=1 Tax=Trichostrongylus colubriformis TaxID=6319 RepID=A0AAN8IMM9_TRICO
MSTVLTMDEEIALKMIRMYAYLHRDVNTSGFRSLDSVLDAFPPIHTKDEWIRLIRDNIHDVEVVPLRDTVSAF